MLTDLKSEHFNHSWFGAFSGDECDISEVGRWDLRLGTCYTTNFLYLLVRDFDDSLAC